MALAGTLEKTHGRLHFSIHPQQILKGKVDYAFTVNL